MKEMVSGKLIPVSETQLLKVEFSILVRFAGSCTECRLEQLVKARFPILFRLSGSISEVSDRQFPNASSSISCKFTGMLISASAWHTKYVDIIDYQLFVVNAIEKWMCFLLAYGRKPRFNIFNLFFSGRCEFWGAKRGK